MKRFLFTSASRQGVAARTTTKRMGGGAGTRAGAWFGKGRLHNKMEEKRNRDREGQAKAALIETA